MVFQFARVGNDQDAKEFLRKLGEESSVSGVVDILSGNDLMDLVGTRAADGDFKPEDLQQVCTYLWGELNDGTRHLPSHQMIQLFLGPFTQ